MLINVDWTSGPIGPGWMMMFPPLAAQETGGTYGLRPQMWFPRPEVEQPKKKSKRNKEEAIAVALLLMAED